MHLSHVNHVARILQAPVYLCRREQPGQTCILPRLQRPRQNHATSRGQLEDATDFYLAVYTSRCVHLVVNMLQRGRER